MLMNEYCSWVGTWSATSEATRGVLCTNLGEVGPPRTSEVDVDQVGLGPERSESETLHPLPPGEESGEAGEFPGD